MQDILTMRHLLRLESLDERWSVCGWYFEKGGKHLFTRKTIDQSLGSSLGGYWAQMQAVVLIL